MSVMKRFPCLEQPSKVCLFYAAADGDQQQQQQQQQPPIVEADSNAVFLRPLLIGRKGLYLGRRRLAQQSAPQGAEFYVLPCVGESTGLVMLRRVLGPGLNGKEREHQYLRVGQQDVSTNTATVGPVKSGDALACFQWRLVRTTTTTTTRDHRYSLHSALTDEALVVVASGPKGEDAVSLEKQEQTDVATTASSETENADETERQPTIKQHDAGCWHLRFLSGELLYMGGAVQKPLISNTISAAATASSELVLNEQQGNDDEGDTTTTAVMPSSDSTNSHEEQEEADPDDQEEQQEEVFLRCDFMGGLGLTPNQQGWEVWRFIESGDGHSVRIASWMHGRYLLADSSGDISTTASHPEATLWEVQKSPTGDGVILGAMGGDGWCYFLCRVARRPPENATKNEQQQQQRITFTLGTTDDATCEMAAWHLESAHQQVYTFHDGRNIMKPSSIGPFPWVTANMRKTDSFRIEVVQQPDNNQSMATLLAMRTNQYVGPVMETGKVALQDTPYQWHMQMNEQDGTYAFWTTKPLTTTRDEDDTPGEQEGNDNSSSQQQRLYLSILQHETEANKGPGELRLVSAEQHATTPGDESSPDSNSSSVNAASITRWRLDPVMPRAVSSSKIRTFAAGTTLAVATTVAMPFAMAGVVGLMGTEMGILGSAVVATLTGAEAVASVGVVGATAAICFRTEANSLSAVLEDNNKEEEEEGGPSSSTNAKYTKRPFCDWRSW